MSVHPSVLAALLAATAVTEHNTVARDFANLAIVLNPLFRAQCIRKMEVVALKLAAHFAEIKSLDLVVLCMGIVEVMRDIAVLGFAVSFFPCQTSNRNDG